MKERILSVGAEITIDSTPGFSLNSRKKLIPYEPSSNLLHAGFAEPVHGCHCLCSRRTAVALFSLGTCRLSGLRGRAPLIPERWGSSVHGDGLKSCPWAPPPSRTWEALQHKRPSGGVGSCHSMGPSCRPNPDHASVLFVYLPVSSTS